jgi:TorA maturation chaperone TorD
LQPNVVETQHSVSEEDVLRANVYALLGRLLARPPSAETLALVRSLAGDDSEFGQAIAALAAVARGTTEQTASKEYHELFYGVAQGELQPYGSYYLTGFLYERPLAQLRGELAELGVVRREDIGEPEDHIAALCETMAGLINGTFGGAAGNLARQRRFFERHVGSWAPRFFADLERAKAARLYMPVGTMGRLFMDIERVAFSIDEALEDSSA